MRLSSNITAPSTLLLWNKAGKRTAEEKQLTVLRRMIWAYFILLILEGALRKWIVPSLSAPLLIVRDPLVLLIYIQAIRCRRFPVNGPMVGVILLFSAFVLLAFGQMVAGIGGGPLVAAYGLRTNFLHLPLIFLIPKVFSYSDVIKLGRWVLLISIPMAVLMIVQFMSPPGHWLNASTGSDLTQLSFAMGRIRPAGTFSYITGAAHFFTLATAFLIYGLAERWSPYSRWLLAAALVSVIAVQPASGSRILVLGCLLVVVAAIVFASLSPGQSYRIVAVAAVICVTLGALSFTSFFREAVEVFMVRWNGAQAADAGGGLGARFLSGFTEPFTVMQQVGLFGQGLGLGTNGASMLMTGSIQFILAEGEWARVVMEVGPILGFSFLVYRVWLAGDIALRAFAGAKHHYLLCWLLAWDACRSLLTEQLSQPTDLGFMVLVSGLCLAAMPSKAAATAVAAEKAAGKKQRLASSLGFADPVRQ